MTLYLDNGQVVLEARDNGSGTTATVPASVVLSDTEFHQAVGVIDEVGGTAQLSVYIDGALAIGPVPTARMLSPQVERKIRR